jgi:hypothetical protein
MTSVSASRKARRRRHGFASVRQSLYVSRRPFLFLANNVPRLKIASFGNFTAASSCCRADDIMNERPLTDAGGGREFNWRPDSLLRQDLKPCYVRGSAIGACGGSNDKLRMRMHTAIKE